MIHQIVWRVGSADSIAFWEERLSGHGTESAATPPVPVVSADRSVMCAPRGG